MKIKSNRQFAAKQNDLTKEEEQYLQKFGARIRRLRKEKGMTQADLVFEAKVHGNMIGRIERGERAANLLQLRKIAKALEISMEELVRLGERDYDS
ncbi:helix-turn-helix domain-containing protein [Flagellimonas sp.]|uniref:helix-turn-helix domain-containing protein n=1 Tax=Flagellimonas sp. TaxID=2058762 RepID=UPI003BADBBA5